MNRHKKYPLDSHHHPETITIPRWEYEELLKVRDKYNSLISNKNTDK